MRRRTGKFGVRKVNVPNLSGLTRSQARLTITSSGLSYSESSSDTGSSNLSEVIASQGISEGSVSLIGGTLSFVYYSYVPSAPPTPTPNPSPNPYPNIGTPIAYGAGSGQSWTESQAYITWGGSGWGSYTVVANNGSSSNSSSSAGGPPVLLSGFSAGTTYSVTVTLYANANYSGASASGSTTFTTAASSSTPTPTPTPSAYCSGTTLVNAAINGYSLVGGNDERECVGTTLVERGVLTYGNSSNNYIVCPGQWYQYPNDATCGYVAPPPSCVCNYSTSETSSIHFAPECCPGGSQRSGSIGGTTTNGCCPNVAKSPTGTFQCKAYDVNNSASVNYFSCYSVGACTAPSNPDGSRAACYS
jgi:hypothetical protein